MQWFKHFSNMRHDSKLRRIFAKYGIEGYGLYCLILETIVEKIDSNNPIPELKDTCDDIALFYNANSARVYEITNYMIEQELIEYDTLTNMVACHKVYKFLESSQTRSAEIRSMIKNYSDRMEQKNLPQMSRTVTDICDRVEENRIDQNRIEENKEKVIKRKFGEFQNVLLSDDELKSLIAKYGDTIIKKYIEKLSSYMASKGKRYKSHKATILSWLQNDQIKQRQVQVDKCPRCGESLETCDCGYGG